MRARQGLGAARFEGLLRRNAGLRNLVAGEIVVAEESIRRTWEVIYGPRRQPRLIVVPTLIDAQRAIDRINAGEFFGEVAVEVSTDTSATRGGLLEPISHADPTYPQVMRDALVALKPGELSTPVLLVNQYAVLMLVQSFEGQEVPLEEVRTEMSRRARLAQERILMDRLARRLLGEVSLTIIDSALKESWDRRYKQGGGPAAR